MKCGGYTGKIKDTVPNLGPVDALSGPRIATKVDKQCLAKYRGKVKHPEADLRSRSMVCRGTALSYLWRTKDVGKLVDALGSEVAETRDMAFEHLKSIMANRPTRRQIRTVAKALSFHRINHLKRARIITALSLAPQLRRHRRLRRRLVSGLKDLLDPKHEQFQETKILALKAAGRLRAKETLPEILFIIKKDDDINVRVAAIHTCMQMRPLRLRDREKIIRTLTEVGYKIRSTVVGITENSATAAAERTIRKVYDWAHADESDVPKDETLFARYLTPLTLSRADVNLFTLWAMHKAADTLDAEIHVRALATVVRALGRLRASDQDSVDLVASALKSPIWHLRKTAAHALTQIEHKDAAALLKEALRVERRKSSYGYITLQTERIGVLGHAYRDVMVKVDRADRRTVEHYAHKFKSKGASKADRLKWIACLNTIGTPRAMRLLVRVSRNEKEFAEVRRAAKTILDEKMPNHVFIPPKPAVDRRDAYSGPAHGAVGIPRNAG